MAGDEANGNPPEPSIGGFAPASLATLLLLVLAGAYTIYFAADLFIPIAAAFLLNLLLAPVVRQLERIHVPPPVSAGLLVCVLIALFGLSFYALAQPAADWMKRGPAVVEELRNKLEEIKKPVRQIQEAAKTVEKATEMDSGTDGERQAVAVQQAGFLERTLEVSQKIGIYLMATLFLLLFLLAGGDMFKEKLVRIAPRLQDKKRVILLIRQVESDVATYLGTVTVINACLGLAIGSAMYLIGLPNAALWGAMAMVLNFIPYVGAIAGCAIVAGAALLSFESLQQAMVAPLLYILLNGLEGSIITPAILGRRLTLNPVMVFVSLMVWGWLWGIAGALMAVPLLVTLKVLSDNIEKLQPLSELLSHRVPGAGKATPPQTAPTGRI